MKKKATKPSMKQQLSTAISLREKQKQLAVNPTEAIAQVATSHAIIIRDVLALDLTPAKLLQVREELEKWGKIQETFDKHMRRRVLELVEKEGEVVSEVGSKEIVHDGLTQRIQPRGGNIDDKKLEALMRAKGIDPETWMDADVKYVHNDDKLKRLVEVWTAQQAGKLEAKDFPSLSLDEINTCRTERTWSLMQLERKEVEAENPSFEE